MHRIGICVCLPLVLLYLSFLKVGFGFQGAVAEITVQSCREKISRIRKRLGNFENTFPLITYRRWPIGESLNNWVTKGQMCGMHDISMTPARAITG